MTGRWSMPAPTAEELEEIARNHEIVRDEYSARASYFARIAADYRAMAAAQRGTGPQAGVA